MIHFIIFDDIIILLLFIMLGYLTVEKWIPLVTDPLSVHTSTGRYSARTTLHITTHDLLSIELKVFQFHMLIHWAFRAVRFIAALYGTCEVTLDLCCSSPMTLPLVVITIALTALIFIQRHTRLRMPRHYSCIFMVCILNHHFWYSILSDTLSYIIYLFWVLSILMFGGLAVE